MRPKLKRTEMPIDLVMAIGLVWGHLSARQFEEAFLLAKGCLRIWPDDRNLILMQSYAAAEVLEPVDVGKLLALRDASCEEWVRLVLRRAGEQSVSLSTEHGNAHGNAHGSVQESAPAAAAKPKSKTIAVARPVARPVTRPVDQPPSPSRPPARQSTADQESNS